MISSRDLEVRTSYSKINITTGKFCSEANGVFKYEVYTPSWAERVIKYLNTNVVITLKGNNVMWVLPITLRKFPK